MNIALVLFAQDYNKVYFSKDWKLTSFDNAMYYRISEFNDTIPSYDGEVIDYYFESGLKQMVGFYKNGNRNGEFKFFCPNGEVKLVINYLNNERTGTWKEYFENDKIKIETKYKDDKEIIIQVNDKNGNTLIKKNKLNYAYMEITQLSHMCEAIDPAFFNKRIKGKIINNIRNGKWELYSDEIKISTLKYENGILIEGFMIYYGQKFPINNNIAFPLINDPVKLSITEGFSFEPGSIIKDNYVIDALHDYDISNKTKIIINDYKELEDYIYDNFQLISHKSERIIKIVIYTNDKVPVSCITIPKLSQNTKENLNSVIESIKQIELGGQDSIVLDYKIKYDGLIKLQ